MKRKEEIRNEIGRLTYECQCFQASENDYMINKLEKRIENLRVELSEIENVGAMDDTHKEA